MDNFDSHPPHMFDSSETNDRFVPDYDSDHIDPAFLPPYDEMSPAATEYGNAEAMYELYEPVTYAEEDKQYVLDVIEQEHMRVRGEHSLSAEERHANKIPFYTKLREGGSVAAAVILDAANNEIDRYSAMNYAEICAGPENVPAVLTFMDKQRQRGEGCNQLRYLLHRTIEVQHIPALYEYVGDYTYLVEEVYRLQDALSIAVAAAQRESDLDCKQQWAEVAETFANCKRPDGELIFDPKLTELNANETSPLKTALKYAKFFNAGTPDMSLNYEEGDDLPGGDLGRLNSLRNLHVIASKQDFVRRGHTIAPFVLGELAEYERSPSPYAVPVGVELEVTEASLLGDYQGPVQIMADLLELKLANVDRITGAGIPQREEEGGGIVTEFAIDPAYTYKTVTREVQHMLALGVISEHTRVPVHATYGNITTEGPKGNAPFVLARCLEATGWACDGRRLRQGLNEINTWAIRGKAGLHERDADTIELGSASAVEQRTLIFKDQGGFVRTLRSGTLLGAAIAAYQHEGSRDAVQEQLALTWESFQTAAQSLFQGYGLTRPTNEWVATEINYDGPVVLEPQLSDDFRRLADLLDQAEADPESDGAHFQDAVQRLIIAHRTRVQAVLNA